MKNHDWIGLILIILLAGYMVFSLSNNHINNDTTQTNSIIQSNNNLIKAINNRDSILTLEIDSIKQDIRTNDSKLPEIKKIYVNEIKAVNDSSIDYNIKLFTTKLSETDSIK